LDAEGLAGADEVLLAAEFFKAAWTHALGQGRGAGRSLGAFGFAVKETHCRPPKE
jgi:hypothetical protein